jgi:hypothetical protein
MRPRYDKFQASGMHRAFVLTLLLLPASARAVTWLPDQALPCRPTIACTADIVPPGDVEVEVGYLFRKLHAPALQHSMPVLVKLTLATWVQLQIGGNGPTFATAPVATRYVDDLVAGLKLHLGDQAPQIPSLSLSVDLSAPISSAAGFERTYDLLVTLYVTKDFGPLHADLNVGVNLWRLEGAPLMQPWIALALSVELPRHFIVMAESYYFADAAPIAPEDGGFLFAVAYSPRRWLVFDVGGDVGYFPSQRAVSAFAGMTMVPAALWRPRR